MKSLMLFAALSLALSCATTGQPVKASDADGRAAEPIPLQWIAAATNAIEGELLCSDLVGGGEQIRIAVRRFALGQTPQVELAYEVPNVLCVYRRADISPEGTVLLPDDLVYAQQGESTRGTTWRMEKAEFEAFYAESPVRIDAVLRLEPSEEQVARQQYRQYLEKRALRLP